MQSFAKNLNRKVHQIIDFERILGHSLYLNVMIHVLSLTLFISDSMNEQNPSKFSPERISLRLITKTIC